jgi:hypothetical protein
MIVKLANTAEVRKALQAGCGPVEVEDDETQAVYVILDREEFRQRYRLVYDTDLPDPREFYSTFATAVRAQA